MRAARYYGKEDIRIEDDVDEAKCGSGQVRVNHSSSSSFGRNSRILSARELLSIQM